ncbi:MAG TPA: ATPase, T2SS/T4P/T4SS family, partial [Myxococcales bacterium]|nr:ATPase, T2SS/T4P/T4SS family [Myxococcales bacterium]
FEEDLRGRFESVLRSGSGLVLVAGASGAGKTTTLYSSLEYVAGQRRSAHLSIEDPIEQRLRVAGVPVDQMELCPERGLTGEAALVAALRQDVDVVAVGEVRTAAEAELAVKAAHTGRLVLAGIHAGSAEEALQRLGDLGVESAMVRKTVLAILHQRLRTVPCPSHVPDCRECGGLGRRRAVEAELVLLAGDARREAA